MPLNDSYETEGMGELTGNLISALIADPSQYRLKLLV